MTKIGALTKRGGKTARLVFRIGRKFVLRPREALLLCRMAWWVCVLSATARLYPLPRALRIVAGSEPSFRNLGSDNRQLPDDLARAIDLLLSANVFLFKPICWKRATVLRRYLSRGGIPTRIVFGVRNEANGKVTGHAWLEAEGTPILESSPPEYVVTYSFPSNHHFETSLAILSQK